MSELMLEPGLYQPPAGFEFDDRFHEREVPHGKKLLLYIGEKAVADIVERTFLGSEEVLGSLLLRLESTTDKAMDLFRHPQAYTSPEVAKWVFEKKAASEEEIDQLAGLPNAA